jgi:hypothetical protein
MRKVTSYPQRFMDRLLRDIKFGIRSFLRTPGFTLVSVLTMALAIGGNTAMFSVMNAVLLRPLPMHEPKRVMVVWQVDPNGGPNAFTTPNLIEWKRQDQKDQTGGDLFVDRVQSCGPGHAGACRRWSLVQRHVGGPRRSASPGERL